MSIASFTSKAVAPTKARVQIRSTKTVCAFNADKMGKVRFLSPLGPGFALGVGTWLAAHAVVPAPPQAQLWGPCKGSQRG